MLGMSYYYEITSERNISKDMGVRPTQLTIKQPTFQKFRPDYDLFQIYKICMNVEMCEMCSPDTHALLTGKEVNHGRQDCNDNKGVKSAFESAD